MGAVLIELLPVIVGAAVVPLYPIVVLLLLQSEGGLRKAIAFVAGGLTIRLVQGILFGLVLGAARETEGNDGPGPVVATLLLLLGILLLTTAYKKWSLPNRLYVGGGLLGAAARPTMVANGCRRLRLRR